MIEGKRDLCSVAIIGIINMSVAKIRQIHLPIYIVALAISIMILNSLFPINTKGLLGIACSNSSVSTNRSACEGFLCAGSGMRSAEREPLAQLYNQYHTGKGAKDETSIHKSFHLTTGVITSDRSTRKLDVHFRLTKSSSIEFGGGQNK